MSIKKLFDSANKNTNFSDYKTDKEKFEFVESNRNAEEISLKNDTFIVKKRWVGFNSTDITSDRYGEPLRPAIHLIAPDNVYDTQAWYDWFKDTKWVSLGELKLDYPIQVNF